MTNPVTVLPAGYVRVRTLQEVEYARDRFPVGATLVVDDATAGRWEKSKLAVVAEPEPAVEMVDTNCPKCHAPMTYPKVPAEGERWTACRGCGAGWLR